MMKKHCSLLVALISLLSGLPALAWDPYGHMLVTSLAYARLNPTAKLTVEKLAAQVDYPGTTYTPITLGCWMDDIRTNDPAVPFQGKFKPWHYINWDIPGDDTTLPPQPETPGDNDKDGNVVDGLKRAIAVLRGGQDPAISSPAIALAIVFHLTGDIHQPLHCASYVIPNKDGKHSTDQGGNRVQITNSPTQAGKNGVQRYNLHMFWDAAYRASLDDATGEVFIDPVMSDFTKKDLELLKPFLNQLETMTPPSESTLETDVEGWAKESHLLARDVAYGELPKRNYHLATRVDKEYVRKASSLSHARIVLAGRRLAFLLNDIYKEPAPTPAPTAAAP